jgi:hypothetical protein
MGINGDNVHIHFSVADQFDVGFLGIIFSKLYHRTDQLTYSAAAAMIRVHNQAFIQVFLRHNHLPLKKAPQLSVMSHRYVTKVVMIMVSGVSVQVSTFWPLASRFWLLASDQWSATIDPSPKSPSEVIFRFELPSGLILRIEDGRTAQ